LGFVNLDIIKLRDCAETVKKLKKKDVILCYYSQVEEKLVSDDLYWIEKNLGDIRYLSITIPEIKEINDEKLVL
jgi:hypothetical protein